MSEPRKPGRYRAALTLAILALAGCKEPQNLAPAAEPVRPALIETVGAASAASELRFPGRLRAAKRAELSFDVPGFVSEFALAEGSQVKAGQVVARLDDGVYRARVEAARAEFERARTDLARYQQLWDSERAVARSEVDDRRSRLESARTSLASAERDLASTLIKAPFAGVLTRRRLEPFTNVQAKQAIAELQDLQALEVVIDVPERVLRSERPQPKAHAVLDGADATRLPLQLKSFAAEADPQTQSYEIVLSVQQRPAGLVLLPGMSVTVLPFADPAAPQARRPQVPLGAIGVDAAGQQGVWVVDDAGRLARRPVRTGAIHGGRIEIAEGLEAGERIVTAGLSALREGMQVRPLAGAGPR